MSRNDLLGNLPVYDRGINRGRLNRSALAVNLNWSHAEVFKAYNNWIQIFRVDGSTLSLEQYLAKMIEAGIRPFEVGNKLDQYQLARYNDEGPYTNGSCRFITKVDNLREMTTYHSYGVLCQYPG